MRHHQKTYDIVYDVVRQNGKKRVKTYDIVRFFGDIVRCTYDVVQKTYDVVYDIVYDIARTTGKNSILTYDVVCRTYDVVYDIVYDICMNRSYLGRIITHNCLNRPCFTPQAVPSRQQ